MNLTVNGRTHEIESAPLTPLLHVLREELTITSPKAGCQQGGCGACTVLLDGEPVRSCLLPVAAVDGSEVTTLEGIGAPDRLAPVQKAFFEQYGSQCGFCTPGFLMATHALLERTPSPSRSDIEHALEGHVCRCTGYVKILASVEAAARGDVGEEQGGPTLDDARPGEPEILVPGSPA
jgi:aerobic-type carbon monoxide dehydrogenase small subunit (CoxS/CutS family)